MASKQTDDGVVKSEQRVKAGGDKLVEPSLSALDQLDADAILIGLCSDVRPLGGLLGFIDWRLCGRVSTMVERGAITGVDGEKVLFPTQGRLKVPRLFLYGWGPHAQAASRGSERVAAMLEMIKKAGGERVVFAFPEPARGLLHLVDDVDKGLGKRVVAIFGADPLPPV
ncbi:MAG TPA: hypothetical protein VGF99_21900 [Myxococcota bacterium]